MSAGLRGVGEHISLPPWRHRWRSSLTKPEGIFLLPPEVLITSNLLTMPLVEGSRSSNHWQAATEPPRDGVLELRGSLEDAGMQMGRRRDAGWNSSPQSRLLPCSLEGVRLGPGDSQPGSEKGPRGSKWRRGGAKINEPWSSAATVLSQDLLINT